MAPRRHVVRRYASHQRRKPTTARTTETRTSSDRAPPLPSRTPTQTSTIAENTAQQSSAHDRIWLREFQPSQRRLRAHRMSQSDLSDYGERRASIDTEGTTMNIVLFTWSPDKFVLSDREWNRRIRQVEDSGFLYDQWSTGNSTKIIQPGDTAFLIRQTRDRGIVSKGEVLSSVFQDLSWNDETEDDEEANYVEIRWTEIVPIDQRLKQEVLEKDLPMINWVRYASGTTVNPQAHEQLLKLWTKTIETSRPRPASKGRHHPPSKTIIESQEGLCCICGIDPQGMYGEPPNHFLTQITLSNDDQPFAVCPNCEHFSHLNPSISTKSILGSKLSSHY